MVGYYIGLALRSLRRTPIMTGLMVLAIGLGIGASMTMITVLHVMTDDPMPGLSGRLFAPHLDPLPKDYQSDGYGPDPSVNFTYPDAMALLRAHRATRQAVMSGGTLLVRPAGMEQRPFYSNGRYTTSEFFSMFGLQFLHGGGWSQQDDDARARVVVLSDSLSRKLFGTHDAINQIVRLGDADLRVIGTTRDWRPRPMFYVDASAKLYSDDDKFFLPLSTAMDLKFDPSGNQSAWGGPSSSLTSPSLTWLQYWVQLDSASQVAAYTEYLRDYSFQQKTLGRFERGPESARLYGLMEWLDYQHQVPSDIRLQLSLALGFLLVCMLNIVALLLAKFLRRGGEISVRRALGARRGDIFIQLGIESVLIGVAGGALGLVIAEFGLWSVRKRPDDYAQLAHMDVFMLACTFALAIVASIAAGLLPAWRACHVTPALQLKTQ